MRERPRPAVGLLAVLAALASAPCHPSDWRQARPPARLSTTLNVDGYPGTVVLSGHSYRGLRITRAQGLAAAAGLRPGDVLLSLNARPVADPEEADSVLTSLPTGNLEIAYAREEGGRFRLAETRLTYINPYREYTRVLRLSVPPVRDSLIEVEAGLFARAVRESLDLSGGRQEKVPLLDRNLTRLARDTARSLAAGQPSGRDEMDAAARALGFAGPLSVSIARGVASLAEAGETLGPPSPTIRQPASLGIGCARQSNGTLVVVRIEAASRHPPEPR